MNEKIKLKKYVIVILFAILFGSIFQDGLRLIVQRFLEISTDEVGFAKWGDTFFLRILVSAIGTAAGAFVIGTLLKRKFRVVAIVATIPTILFWVVTIFLITSFAASSGYIVEDRNRMLLISAILIILSPTVAYFASAWGHEYFDNFKRSKSVLNIKWFHWFWILPFYLNKIVAVPLFVLLFLWKVDAQYDSNFYLPFLLDLFSNWSYYLVRIILIMIFVGLVSSVSHAYKLLTQEKIGLKNGILIFAHVLLLSIVYVLLFGSLL